MPSPCPHSRLSSTLLPPAHGPVTGHTIIPGGVQHHPPGPLGVVGDLRTHSHPGVVLVPRGKRSDLTPVASLRDPPVTAAQAGALRA